MSVPPIRCLQILPRGVGAAAGGHCFFRTGQL